LDEKISRCSWIFHENGAKLHLKRRLGWAEKKLHLSLWPEKEAPFIYV
jgi:hypothetical protein